jgi:hypothetical protein
MAYIRLIESDALDRSIMTEVRGISKENRKLQAEITWLSKLGLKY